jgi:hypothetical protein
MAPPLKSDRAYFWSNSYAQPKSKSKFLVEFGGELDTVFNGKYSWLVKSVSRPKYTAEYEDYKNSVTYLTTKALPKSWNWEPVTVKFVNPFSMTFWPADIRKDLDLFMSDYIQSFVKKDSYNNDTTGVLDENGLARISNTSAPSTNTNMEETTSRYFGNSIKVYDLSMGFQSPGLGSGGGVYNGVNSNAQGKEQYNDISNPTISSLELTLGEMYYNGYWEYSNPWIVKVDLGDHDYATDDFIEISITFKFQNAIYVSKLREDQMASDPDKLPIVIENLANEITKLKQDYSRKDIGKEQYDLALDAIEKAAADAEKKSRPKENENNTSYNKQRLEALQALTTFGDTSLELVDSQQQSIEAEEEVKNLLQSNNRNSADIVLTIDAAKAAREEEAIATQNQQSAQEKIRSYSETATVFDENPDEYNQIDQTVPRTNKTSTSTAQTEEKNQFNDVTTPAPAADAPPAKSEAAPPPAPSAPSAPPASDGSESEGSDFYDRVYSL